MKPTKYNYLYILQGNYGYGFEDLTAECKSDKDARKNIRQSLKDYRDNEGGCYRIIERRELKVFNL